MRPRVVAAWVVGCVSHALKEGISKFSYSIDASQIPNCLSDFLSVNRAGKPENKKQKINKYWLRLATCELECLLTWLAGSLADG